MTDTKRGRKPWVVSHKKVSLGTSDLERLNQLFEGAHERATMNDIILLAIKELHDKTFNK